jgi:hypothetical protein
MFNNQRLFFSILKMLAHYFNNLLLKNNKEWPRIGKNVPSSMSWVYQSIIFFDFPSSRKLIFFFFCFFDLGPDEYFYKRRPQTRSSSHPSSKHSSNNSSMSPNEERRGGSDEFERMYQRYYDKHSK